MIKFFKDLYSNKYNGSYGDYILTTVLWLVTVIGGSFTISTIGRALMSFDKKLGTEFGIFCLITLIGIGFMIFSHDWMEDEKVHKEFQENIRKCERELEERKSRLDN